MAATIGKSSSSTSRRLSVMALSHGKENCIAVDGLRQRLVACLQQRQGAEQPLRLLARVGVQLETRQRQRHLEVAPQCLVNERRRRTYHLLEIVVAGTPRLERVYHHMDG